MAINPHTNAAAATAWNDQFAAELKERSRNLLETSLHRQGLCSERLGEATLLLLDCAQEAGMVAMGVLLEEKGRLKGPGVEL